MKKILVILLPFLLGLYFAFAGPEKVTLSHAGNACLTDPGPSVRFQRDQRAVSLMDSTLCNGFDFPVNDKNMNQWAVTQTDSLENWKNKTSGSLTIYAIAAGKVISAGNGTVTIEHRFTENGKVGSVYSSYSGLTAIYASKGEQVSRGKNIGSITGHSILGLSIKEKSRIKELPYAFIRSHRKLTVPFREDKLVLIDKGNFKCHLYNKGKILRTYEIALGQVPVGAKEKQGDLKVPEGEYRICEKSKGPFNTAGNWSAAYLGTRWMCLTYPNTHDAKKALDKKMITKEQFNKIEQATKAGLKPPQNTALGGGIGLHGWIEEDWSNDSDRAQTWGCVSFHNNDLNEIYDLVEMKTKIIIIP